MLKLAGRAEHTVDRGESADRGRNGQTLEAFVSDGDVRDSDEVTIRGDDALLWRIRHRRGKVDRIDFGKVRFVAILRGDCETLIPFGLNGDESVLTIGSEDAEVGEGVRV